MTVQEEHNFEKYL